MGGPSFGDCRRASPRRPDGARKYLRHTAEWTEAVDSVLVLIEGLVSRQRISGQVFLTSRLRFVTPFVRLTHPAGSPRPAGRARERNRFRGSGHAGNPPVPGVNGSAYANS